MGFNCKNSFAKYFDLYDVEDSCIADVHFKMYVDVDTR